ncbi:NAD-dependent epimerase/dehydratase family protein [Campylobacter sputorum]|uniref:NAD-dependent epimerase/dehydratase family protein n=1 Tax=Campylobacter sputorum TaxID=206 RepID=UPI000B78D647|nr:NAD-dependent epimerase/dehydratase family protein [Campylobacter sputorum]ASM37285.1 NAD-dependent epimerase/dehydratase [Campylobacter sputorum bv. faecalis CCUG 20703]
MKILLLGGTGVMGKYLTDLLLSQGYEIYITSRLFREKKGIHFIKGDAKNTDFLKTVLNENGFDVIVDFMVYNTDEFKNRVDLLLNATSHYIFLSTSRVYSDSVMPITENTIRLLDSCTDLEYLQTEEYALTKARQENILFSANKKNWTIIRPYITYGINRLQLGNLEKEIWLRRAIEGKTIVFCKEISECYTTLTYGKDVAKSFIPIFNNSNAFGNTYHICANKKIKWIDVLNIYLDVLEKHFNKRPKVILQKLDDYLKWNPGKYQIIYDRLYNREFDNSKINEFIDVGSFNEVEQTLVMCLEEFLENPKFLHNGYRVHGSIDKITKEKTKIKDIKPIKQKIAYILYRYMV